MTPTRLAHAKRLVIKVGSALVTNNGTGLDLNAINDATGQWKMLINRSVRDINPNPFVMNLKNGLYNLLDGSFRDHDPAYMSTVQIGAAYRPGLLLEPDTG